MRESKMRPVKLWDAEVAWETRDDGSMLVWQTEPLPDYPDRLSDRIRHWAESTPDAPWMAEREGDGWRKVTYAELLRKIRSIGQALIDMGLTVERPLLILSGNSIPHALMALGAQYAGIPSAAIAPAYALVSEGYQKLTSVRDQITPGAVFADALAPFLPALDAVMPDLPRIGGGGIGLDTLLATEPGTVDAANAATGPDTVAKFMFTSGTTGSPKAVILTQRMMCSNQAMVADLFRYFEDEPPVLLDWAPWNHVAAGTKVFNMNIWHGGCYHIDAGKPAPAKIQETIRNLRDVSPNWYFNVPAGYDMLVEAMKADATLAAHFFRDMKLMMYAGAAMAQHTWDDLERLAVETCGERVFLTSSLGATETAPMALFCTEPQSMPGNIGIPAKGLVLKLVPNDGKWEARIKAPSVTPGYWRNPQLTAEAFDEEGFYKLGDALRFAVEGDPARGFFFDGRVAENFKLATGTWVAVGALRAKLTNVLGGLARDVVIAGEGQEELGALLVPFRPAIERIVPRGEALPDAELVAHPALRAEVAKRLAAYNAQATGSSMRVPRALFMVEPLDLDRGEITDKGSVNQRAVLNHRPELAAALFDESDPRLIHSA